VKLLSLVRGQARLNLLRAIRIFPYIFLWIDSVSFFLYKLEIYKKMYLVILSMAGHSVLWVLYVSLMLLLLKPCGYTWICMGSLLMFNLVSLLPANDFYYTIFMSIIIFTGISMSSYLIVKRWIKRQYITL